jgi:hypothetical protein
VRLPVAVVVLVLVACSNGPAHPRVATGGITGITYDRVTGYAISGAQVRAVLPSRIPILAISAAGGLFDLTDLAPGRYTLRGEFANQVVELPDVDVSAGEVTLTKLPFASGSAAGSDAPPRPLTLDSSTLTQITRYRRGDLGEAGRIEGFVIEAATHAAVTGAIVTVTSAATPGTATQQTSSDDRGAFRFDALLPGTYALSAYYSLAHRGQIEVRRGDVAVAAAEVVVVPLVVDTAR